MRATPLLFADTLSSFCCFASDLAAFASRLAFAAFSPAHANPRVSSPKPQPCELDTAVCQVGVMASMLLSAEVGAQRNMARVDARSSSKLCAACLVASLFFLDMSSLHETLHNALTDPCNASRRLQRELR